MIITIITIITYLLYQSYNCIQTGLLIALVLPMLLIEQIKGFASKWALFVFIMLSACAFNTDLLIALVVYLDVDKAMALITAMQIADGVHKAPVTKPSPDPKSMIPVLIGVAVSCVGFVYHGELITAVVVFGALLGLFRLDRVGYTVADDGTRAVLTGLWFGSVVIGFITGVLVHPAVGYGIQAILTVCYVQFVLDISSHDPQLGVTLLICGAAIGVGILTGVIVIPEKLQLVLRAIGCVVVIALSPAVVIEFLVSGDLRLYVVIASRGVILLYWVAMLDIIFTTISVAHSVSISLTPVQLELVDIIVKEILVEEPMPVLIIMHIVITLCQPDVVMVILGNEAVVEAQHAAAMQLGLIPCIESPTLDDVTQNLLVASLCSLPMPEFEFQLQQLFHCCHPEVIDRLLDIEQLADQAAKDPARLIVWNTLIGEWNALNVQQTSSTAAQCAALPMTKGYAVPFCVRVEGCQGLPASEELPVVAESVTWFDWVYNQLALTCEQITHTGRFAHAHIVLCSSVTPYHWIDYVPLAEELYATTHEAYVKRIYAGEFDLPIESQVIDTDVPKQAYIGYAYPKPVGFSHHYTFCDAEIQLNVVPVVHGLIDTDPNEMVFIVNDGPRQTHAAHTRMPIGAHASAARWELLLTDPCAVTGCVADIVDYTAEVDGRFHLYGGLIPIILPTVLTDVASLDDSIREAIADRAFLAEVDLQWAAVDADLASQQYTPALDLTRYLSYDISADLIKQVSPALQYGSAVPVLDEVPRWDFSQVASLAKLSSDWRYHSGELVIDQYRDIVDRYAQYAEQQYNQSVHTWAVGEGLCLAQNDYTHHQELLVNCFGFSEKVTGSKPSIFPTSPVLLGNTAGALDIAIPVQAQLYSQTPIDLAKLSEADTVRAYELLRSNAPDSIFITASGSVHLLPTDWETKAQWDSLQSITSAANLGYDKFL